MHGVSKNFFPPLYIYREKDFIAKIKKYQQPAELLYFISSVSHLTNNNNIKYYKKSMKESIHNPV